MLRDVSSMANADGGIMIVGMDEDGREDRRQSQIHDVKSLLQAALTKLEDS